MSARVVLSLSLALLVTACSSVNDRYAFWRDDAPRTYQGHKPNLGDVPPAPKADVTKADMDTLRTQLETERDNAYKAAGQLPPVSGQAPTDVVVPAAAPAAPVQTMTTTTTNTVNTVQTMPFMTPAGPQQSFVGNVVYNYGDQHNGSQPYAYGLSPVNIRASGQDLPPRPTAAETHAPSSDPSVTINWSAMGSGTHSSAAPAKFEGLGGQPVVYFKYGSARLSPSDKHALQNIVETAKNQSVVVIGHASKPTGISDIATSREVNLKMSGTRATAVMRELARLGVSPDNINVAAYGDTTAQGNPSQDQRVDIKVNN
jgi:outer membrane protein OmpA-like peptidoglycan-associated protein